MRTRSTGILLTLMTSTFIWVACGTQDNKQVEAEAFEEYVVLDLELLDREPAFRGGMEELSDYLARAVVYPVAARELKVEGTVVVGFSVDRKGNVKDVALDESVEPSLDQEALRVVREMPSWTPGVINGGPVTVRLAVPIVFEMEN